jgi:hypothetical protein
MAPHDVELIAVHDRHLQVERHEAWELTAHALKGRTAIWTSSTV